MLSSPVAEAMRSEKQRQRLAEAAASVGKSDAQADDADALEDDLLDAIVSGEEDLQCGRTKRHCAQCLFCEVCNSVGAVSFNFIRAFCYHCEV